MTKMTPIFKKTSYAVLLVLLMISSGVCQAQSTPGQGLETIARIIVGPHITMGYEHRQRSNFNLGYAVNTLRENGYPMFRFKPHVSFGKSTIYGFGLGYYPLAHDGFVDRVDDASFGESLALSNLGANLLHSPDKDSMGIEALYRFSLLYVFDLEFGYTWLLSGQEESFDKVFKIGLNLNLSPKALF